MKVLWLHYKISTGLVAEVYACTKKKIKERLGYIEHPNTAKENGRIRQNHAKNRLANHKKFRMFGNTTIVELKTTIT